MTACIKIRTRGIDKTEICKCKIISFNPKCSAWARQKQDIEAAPGIKTKRAFFTKKGHFKVTPHSNLFVKILQENNFLKIFHERGNIQKPGTFFV